jgi:hypothetical protein
MRLLLGCLASGLLLGSASAQDPFDSSHVTAIDWNTGTWGDGAVTRVLKGDFNHDFYQDLVLLDGGDLIQAFAPAVFTFRSLLDVDIVDACVVPAAAPGSFDGIVASDAAGWREVCLNFTGCDHEPTCDHVDTETHTDTNWVNARSLQTLYAPTLTPRVVALDEAGARLLMITDPFIASPGTPTASVVDTLDSDGLAIAAVNWDGSGLPEVAVLHESGLSIYDVDGGSIQQINRSVPGTPLQGGCLVGFRQDQTSPERVAIAYVDNSGNTWLKVYDSSETEDAVPLKVTISSVQHTIDTPYAIAAGKLGTDLAEEIVVAHRDSDVEGPVIFNNLCGGVSSNCDTFNESASWVPDLDLAWTTPAAHVANPVFADLTSDGDDDLVWFQEDESVLLLAENTTLDHTTQYVTVQDTQSLAVYDNAVYPAVPDGCTISVKLSPPTTTLTFAPNRILIEQWWEGSYPLTLDPVGVQAVLRSYLSGTQWTTVRTNLFLFPWFLNTTGFVHLTIRAVHVHTEGEEEVVDAAGPASTYSIALGDSAKEALDERLLDLTGQRSTQIPPLGFNLSAYTGTEPKDYEDGPYGGNNASEGGGGGKPPRPPPGGNIDPPVTPHNP